MDIELLLYRIDILLPRLKNHERSRFLLQKFCEQSNSSEGNVWDVSNVSEGIAQREFVSAVGVFCEVLLGRKRGEGRGERRREERGGEERWGRGEKGMRGEGEEGRRR
jgi:hypothetical protein